MATLNINKKDIEKYIKLSTENIEKINMMGVPAELHEDTLVLEVLPNRPDLLSLQGFLRYFNAYSGKEVGLKKYKVTPSGNKVLVEKSLPKEWPYAVACIVKGIEFDDAKIKEIIDIQEKLGATWCRKRKKGGIGLYPLNKIKFPVKLAGFDKDKIKFRPLESEDEMSGRQILAKHPTGIEYASIVENWDKLPAFVDADKKIMSMPPIINSHDMGKIDLTTKDVFIEATGPDYGTIKKAVTVIATALADMGGKIYSVECVQQDGKKESMPDLSPDEMKVNIENINKTLGLELKEKDVEKLLPRMGYDYSKGKVKVPAWRTDVIHEVDIIEDVAIAYGYEKLVPEIPELSSVGELHSNSKIENKISDCLTGLGLLEISSYNLIKENECKKNDITLVEVENSKTEYKFLRPNLIIPALRTFSENKDNEYPQKIFEIGKVFKRNNSNNNGIKEERELIIACSPSNFTEIKQILDYISRMLGFEYVLSETENDFTILGRTGEIRVKDKISGFLGEISPKELKNWGIKMPVSIISLNIDEIFN